MWNKKLIEYSRNSTYLISLDKEVEMNTIDPEPNQNADLATLFHIIKSLTISQRISQPFCP
jgi:hypothetical protein